MNSTNPVSYHVVENNLLDALFSIRRFFVKTTVKCWWLLRKENFLVKYVNIFNNYSPQEKWIFLSRIIRQYSLYDNVTSHII